MSFTDNEDVPRTDHLFLCVELVHHLSFGTETDEDEVHSSWFCRHRCLVDTFGQQKIVVEIGRLTPCLDLVQVGFFDLYFYHVLMFLVSPAFSLMVLSIPLYKRETRPSFLALMVQL